MPMVPEAWEKELLMAVAHHQVTMDLLEGHQDVVAVYFNFKA